MELEKKIIEGVASAISTLYNAQVNPQTVQVQRTRKEFEGEFTVVMFPFLKTSGKSPEDTGTEVGQYLMDNHDFVASIQIVKGFLNLTLTTQAWAAFFNSIQQRSNYGFGESTGKQIILEYSSPNTNKPLHLGHIRNNLLGYSVAQLLEANGHKVIKAQIINDRGIHICKSMVAWQKFGDGETPDSAAMKGDHLVGKYYVMFDKVFKQEVATLVEEGVDQEEAEKQAPILLEAQDMLRKWEAKDTLTRELWEKMNSWVYAGFDQTYKALGVEFDKLYYESITWELGKKFVDDNTGKVFFKKEDGSVWCDLTDEGLDNKLVLRADGTAVYMTQDLGTAAQRFLDFPDTGQMIYTVGNEQEYHFKVLFKILKKLGYDWADECFHLSYGMVELPEGKMKSREGTVVDADDLIAELISSAGKKTEDLGKLDGFTQEEKSTLFEQIGLAALKYFILKVDPKKGMMFDPEESIDMTGNTGPFIQYTYARINSLISKSSISITNDVTFAGEIVQEERDLLQHLYYYPDTIKDAGKQYSPALVANYLYDLVKSYNRFYQSVPPILKDEDSVKTQRIALSKLVASVIKSGMGILGIEVPDRM